MPTIEQLEAMKEFGNRREPISLTYEQLEAVKIFIRGKVGSTGQFGDFKADKSLYTGNISVCSTVDARNGYGGRTGMRPFIAIVKDGTRVTWALIDKQDGRSDITRICKNLGLRVD